MALPLGPDGRRGVGIASRTLLCFAFIISGQTGLLALEISLWEGRHAAISESESDFGSPVRSGSTPRSTLADNRDMGNLFQCGMMDAEEGTMRAVHLPPRLQIGVDRSMDERTGPGSSEAANDLHSGGYSTITFEMDGNLQC